MPSRRAFLRTAGASLLVPLIPACLRDDRGRAPGPVAPGPFVEVHSSGLITVWLTKSEMGQGVWTALPMIVAEELDAEWPSVRVRQADNLPAFGEQMTGGSASVSTSWEPLRRAGAQARQMLLLAAAARWNVPVTECRTQRGRVLHTSTRRSVAYGSLVAAASVLPVPQDVALKPPSQFRLVGRPLPRLDSAAKCTGQAAYGLDTRIPGMRVAVVARPPGFLPAEPTYDEEASRGSPGVVDVVRVPSGIAVVARDTWSAIRGRRALACRWSGNSALDSAGIAESLLRRADRGAGAVARDEGDSLRILGRTRRRLTAEYVLPFLAHAPMEPMNCVARVTDGRCELWAPTQAPTGAAAAVAEALELPIERVTVHTTWIGGGFGRRLLHDFAVEAALVAREVGVPVQVVWTREDDLGAGWYRPASLHRLSAALDGGRPVAWRHLVVTPSIDGTREPTTDRDEFNPFAVMGFAALPYSIPNLRVEYARVNTPVPVAWWRSVYSSQLAFANESFIDELAAAAGTDPVDFRLGLLPAGSRDRAVLELAADRAGWNRRRPSGRALGVALHDYFGTAVAQVAEVEVAGDAAFKVVRVVCAVDCGLVVHPGIAEAQIQGGVLFGLSAALHESITIRNGAAVETNFHQYRLLRMDEAPPVEVHFLRSQAPPSGLGEPGTPPVAPAVANAVFAAAGRRIRRLPLG